MDRSPEGIRRRAPMSGRDVALLRSLAERIDPNDAGAHNNLGVVFFQKGLIRDAVAAFERALELDPRLDVARRNAEIAYLETGHFRRRLAELGARLDADPADEEAREALARTCLLGGDVDGAVREWERLLGDHPDSALLLMKLAYAEAERGDPQRALDLLRRAAQLTPDDPRVHFHTGELLLRTGDAATAEPVIRRALALDDTAARGHALLARTLEALGRPADAARALNRARELDPAIVGGEDNLSLERYLSARTARRAASPEPVRARLGRYARATELRRVGDLVGAARELERARREGEDTYEVRQSLAELALLGGDLERARVAYAALLEERDDSPKLWNEHGVVLHRAGHLDRAVSAYRRTVALDHAYAIGWNNLGVALAQEGRADYAERALHKAAVADAPPEVLWNLGLFLTLSDRADEAVEVYRQAAERDDTLAESWSRLGGALFQEGAPEHARIALVRALELDPDLAEARYQLGFTLSALGDFAGALRETKRALELDPVFPPPRYRLLVDVQFEDGSLPAPATDRGEQVRTGTEIRSFRFHSAALDEAFAGFSDPAASPPAPTPRAPALAEVLGSTRAALRHGRLRRAADLAARAVALSPRSAEALALQAEAFLRRGLAGEALERFDAVLSAPSHAARQDGNARQEASLGRARALLALGRPAEAVRAASAASATRVAGAQAVLGRALLASGDPVAAVAAYEAGGEAEKPSVLVEHGEALLAADRPAEAGRVFRRALQLDPDAVAARVGLARGLVALGDVGAAEAEYAAAVRALPSYGEAALGLAEVQWRNGRTQDAVRTLVELLSLDPTHVDSLVRLGTWLLELGRVSQAATALRRALILAPDHEVALAALSRLGAGED